MPTTTTLGYPIPLDSDPVADLALAVRNLGQKVDDNVGVLAAGSGTIDLVSAATGTVVINFPAGRFTAAPVVVATTNMQNYYCNIAAVSATSVTVRATHRDGTAATATVIVHAVAVQQ